MDRYITRQITSPMLLIIGLLVALFVTYSLTRFLTDAASGLLNLVEVSKVTGYRGAIALEVLIPISLYIAIVMGLGRLYSDYEMDVLRSAGVSRARLLRPIVLLALGVAILVWVASLVIRPWAYSSIYQLEAEAEASDELTRIKPGQFYHYENQDRTVFVRDRKRGSDELGGVFVRTRTGDAVEVIASATGQVTEFASESEHELRLFNARILRAEREDFNLLGEFSEFRLSIPVAIVSPPPYKSKSASSIELAASSNADDQAEFQWRLSTGLSTLLLALLAVPLSHSLPRQGRYAKVMIAVGIYAAYYILMGVARTWVEQGSQVTLLWVPVLLFVVVIVAYAPWRRGEL